MGTWGPGNFDNDIAADHVTRLSDGILRRLRRSIKTPKKLEPDEPESFVFMADLQLLTVIAGAVRSDPPFKELALRLVPERAELEHWKKSYLAVWDEYIDELNPSPEFKRARRDAIKETFDEIIELSASGNN